MSRVAVTDSAACAQSMYILVMVYDMVYGVWCMVYVSYGV